MVDALVRASGVVVIDVLEQDAPQMSSIEDENEIQALIPGRKEPTFSKRVGIRGLDRSGGNVGSVGPESDRVL